MIILSQNWWLIVLRGLAAVLFGLAAFVWPGLTLLALVILFGFYALIDGIIALVSGLAHVKDGSRWWVFVLEGLVGIAAGVIALLRPGVATAVLLLIIAAWAILTGIFELAAAIRLRREISNEWLLALSGVLSILLGVLLVIQPVTGTLAVIWIIGAYSLVFGVVLIALGVRLRSWHTLDEPSSGQLYHST